MPKYLIVCLLLLLHLSATAQEFAVASFEIAPKDLTARVNSRIDANGRKCAVVKVYVADNIAAARGSVVGDIVSAGMEKWVYMSHDSKQLELVFEHHLPLHIKFMDHDYPSLSGQMTYILKLSEAGAPAVSQTAPAVVAPAPVPDVNEVYDRAVKAYDDHLYATAYDLFMSIRDDKRAQNYIGLIHENGHLGKVDYSEAVRWYRKAAEQGNDAAQNNLGYMYANGRGVSQDYSEAVRWYRKSAEQGNALGQSNLGYMYETGHGVGLDYSEAVRWYRKSAEQGNARGQCNLGYMYDSGRGVSQDYSEAARWYRKSAEQGFSTGQCNLGYMYDSGRGVDQDLSEAVRWYRKSAEQGFARGQYNLGHMYENGRGVGQNVEEAVRWYRKAAAQNYTLARDALTRLGR